MVSLLFVNIFCFNADKRITAYLVIGKNDDGRDVRY